MTSSSTAAEASRPATMPWTSASPCSRAIRPSASGPRTPWARARPGATTATARQRPAAHPAPILDAKPGEPQVRMVDQTKNAENIGDLKGKKGGVDEA